jgi:outer membrane protein assembly factor BamE (lipoprotein component of BamABCDE complex)
MDVEGSYDNLLRIVVAACVLVLSGCSYALGPYQLIDGREFDRTSLDRVAAGMRSDKVASVLGEPVEKSSARATVTWKYRAVYQRRGDQVELFGIIPVKRRPKERYEATFVFRDGVLEHAMYFERLPEAATSRMLVPK